jgi:LysM repeat protein
MFASKSTALTVLLAFAASALAGKCVREYSVVSGDTCDGISLSQHVSTFQLAAVNSGINAGCTNLEIDTVVCLGTEGEDCNTTYVVKPGDTCSAIANAVGLNVTMLALNNPQIDDECSNVYIGEVLCVAPEVIVPPVPANFIDPTPPGAQPATPPPVHDVPPVNVQAAPAPPEDDADLPFCDELEDE